MSGIELDGFEELEALLQDMTLTEADEKKAMKDGIDVIYNAVESNTPVGETGKMKKEIKTKVSKDDFSVTGQVIMGAWYTGFEEFGTSQQKHHVGFFERSVNSSQNEALEVLAKGLLK
ncbi:HK97-gp10 family putative phage morphogenesis protein [Clostridium beijerinckii]|uniref:HK97-gp10 family putative phage morphogenesis protein n=3 Tax=Clostridium beijerinckii TaxID=1520 RepID=UPI000A1C7961|nr:HK97-gp10 family putative phage morphogenesis protein [Clostridium beijerinckii]MBA8935901.1 HK97 gp10 family phage protein [Clostridium beijerinckii]NRU35973.1 HK97 gp10 family phage protein [Clostridium beijerinckii]NSB00746.1 HK97 gp10 family phage protein [Clostridium beijerinckii]CUU45470.1 Phage protein, HK97 gp10 family [Clostridium beijerinckii]